MERLSTSACLHRCVVSGLLRRRLSLSLSVTTSSSGRTPWRWASSTPTPPANGSAFSSPSTLSVKEFLQLTPQLLLRSRLQQYTELDGTEAGAALHPGEDFVIINRSRFDEFCAVAHVEDAEAALQNLTDAGYVIPLDNGSRIHLRPVQYLDSLAIIEQVKSQRKAGAEDLEVEVPPSLFIAEAARRVEKLEKQEAAMRERLQPAILKAARWRRSLWGGALFYAGAQLAIISRLTYFDLDWDIMEPVSYCLATGTALLLYLYLLRYGEEHSCAAVDARFLPQKVRQYAPKDFDWETYGTVCQQLVEEKEMLRTLKKWIQKH